MNKYRICSAPDLRILCQGALFVIHDRLLSPSMATNTLATGTQTLRKDSGE
ncbi:MAG: hypothetical protein R6V21_05905 [Pelovirga sp.]